MNIDTAPADAGDDVIANGVGAETDDDAPAEQAAPTIGRRDRKPLNRDLFKRAVAAVKSHLETDDEPADELLETGAAKPVEVAKPPTPEKPSEPPRGPAPEAIAAWERANLRAAELDKRETALKEREARTRDVASRFSADPFKALQDTIRADLGEGATDDEVGEEVAWQVTQMSLALAGAQIPPDNMGHELKKLRREVNQRKASERKAAADAETKRGAEEKEARTKAAIVQIGREFAEPRKDAAGKELPPIAAGYPWLAAAENPADLLFDVIKREHERSGTILEISDAAKLADDYLADTNRAWFKKNSHLLAPTPAPTSTTAAVPQGDPQRRSRTLTNADASEESAPAPVTPGRPLSTEERRRKTFGKWMPKLKESDKR